jgi:hypothetical protein
MGNIKETNYYDAKTYWKWRANKYDSSYQGRKAINLVSTDNYYFNYIDSLDKKAVFDFVHITPGLKVLEIVE